MKPFIDLNNVNVKVFGMSTPEHALDDVLVGTGSCDLLAFAGGKHEDWRDAHILDTLDNEHSEELCGTIVPSRFNNSYNLHFAFAHELPFMHWADARTFQPLEMTNKNKDIILIRNAYEAGHLNLYIMFRMYEVSGNKLVEVNAKEMAQPHYLPLSRRGREAEVRLKRASVQYTIDRVYNDGRWKANQLTPYNPAWPLLPKMEAIRTQLRNKMGVIADTIDERFADVPLRYRVMPQLALAG